MMYLLKYRKFSIFIEMHSSKLWKILMKDLFTIMNGLFNQSINNHTKNHFFGVYIMINHNVTSFRSDHISCRPSVRLIQPREVTTLDTYLIAIKDITERYLSSLQGSRIAEPTPKGPQYSPPRSPARPGACEISRRLE